MKLLTAKEIDVRLFLHEDNERKSELEIEVASEPEFEITFNVEGRRKKTKAEDLAEMV